MIDPQHQPLECTPAHPDRPSFSYALTDHSTTPAATVITPYFNAGPEFAETARCVLGQSLQQLEWIIVNDGSTDADSLAQLDRYRPHGPSHDPRIRVIDHDENKGLPAARNTGFASARTPYVYQLDADDLIEPTTVEKCLMALAHRPELGFVSGHSAGFGTQSYVWRHGFERAKGFLKQNWTTATAMIRRSVWQDIGGYDETRRGGLEDWDFWLRAAAHGHWGVTIPEVLDWYRRRDDHAQVWSDFGDDDRRQQLLDSLIDRFPQLEREPWPTPKPAWPTPLQAIRRDAPLTHTLAKTGPRLLMVLPWLRMGGADKFNRDLVEQLRARGWDITIATTSPTNHGWLGEFAELTPDIFHLDHYAGRHDAPSLLRWLIESRSPDAVLLSNSDLGYQLLPWLRTVCPKPAYVDYNHMEEPYWKSGGHPRSGAAMGDLLDMQACTSDHLRDWMIEHGSHPERIHTCTINVDPNTWKPDAGTRTAVRDELGIDADTPVILYAGRICQQKQPMVFARTMAELDRLASGKPFVALVAGSGEDEPQLRAQLERDGLLDRRVKLLGEVKSERMRELMPASDIFFLPSRWEGIALTLYEAMASGVVCVGADVGGQRELVTPETGVLLPKAKPGREPEDEPGPYARALWALIAKPDRLAEMGRAARQRITHGFSVDQMGDRMATLIENAIEQHRAAPSSTPKPTLSKGLAEELACRALEADRLQRACDRLWNRLQQVGEPAPAAKPTREVKPKDPSKPARSASASKEPAPKAKRGKRPAAPPERKKAKQQLALIESAAGWRFVMRCRRSAPARLIGQTLHGRAWSADPFPRNPIARVDAITRSKSFKLASLFGMPKLDTQPKPTTSPERVIETKPTAERSTVG